MTTTRIAQQLLAPPGLSPAVPAERTLQAVIEQYSNYVATIAFRILGRGSDLDDVLQDVFLEVHRNLHTIRDWAALQAWLATVTVRASRRVLRQRRLARLFEPSSDEAAFEPIDPNTSAEEMLTYGRVYRALDRLPSDQRIAWTMQVLQGDSLQEIAAICRCSVSAVKRRVARAQEAVDRELGR